MDIAGGGTVKDEQEKSRADTISISMAVSG